MNGETEPMVPGWMWDVFVLCLILVPFLVLGAWAMWEHRQARRQQRERRRLAKQDLEDALDLRLAIGLTCANRDGLLEPRPRLPEDVQ